MAGYTNGVMDKYTIEWDSAGGAILLRNGLDGPYFQPGDDTRSFELAVGDPYNPNQSVCEEYWDALN